MFFVFYLHQISLKSEGVELVSISMSRSLNNLFVIRVKLFLALFVVREEVSSIIEITSFPLSLYL